MTTLNVTLDIDWCVEVYYSILGDFSRIMVRKARSGATRSVRRGERGKRKIDRGLRIIGGRLRNSKLFCSDETRVRPMKDRVREAIFNLIGPSVKGKHVLDLFAGTGALALEALSRGATSATLIERHFPTVQLIRKNLILLDVEEQTEVAAADTFYWVEHQLTPVELPWLVFCSPPYDFFVDRHDDILKLVWRIVEQSPQSSVIVVESDERFDFADLPSADQWEVRAYPPAKVGIWHVERSTIGFKK